MTVIRCNCSILVTVCFVMQVEDLIAKEKEMQEKLMSRHSNVVDSFEKKLRGQDVENRIAQQQQKITALRQEVEFLLDYISEI
jgi:oligosaccharyltransferase complex subunit alpha (ribophorin I)